MCVCVKICGTGGGPAGCMGVRQTGKQYTSNKLKRDNTLTHNININVKGYSKQ